MAHDFYDRHGRAIAFSDDDDEALYLWNGRPIAFLNDGKVYAYSGRFVGWFEHGWLRDRRARCVAFTEDAEGGPAKPARHARPARGVRRARPARGARQAAPARPARSTSWSDSTLEELAR
jgi:hypothetical protein